MAALDLNEALEYQDNQFPEIPEGEYDAVIDHVENGRIDNDGKYNGYAVCNVYVNLQVGNQEMQHREGFILSTDFQWKLCQLFIGTGQMKKGEALPNLGAALGQLAGQTCRVKVTKKGRGGDRVFTNLTFLEKKQAAWGGGF